MHSSLCILEIRPTLTYAYKSRTFVPTDLRMYNIVMLNIVRKAEEDGFCGLTAPRGFTCLVAEWCRGVLDSSSLHFDRLE